MAQFKAITPNAEVNGETVYSVVDGMGYFREKALAFLRQNGIDNPTPGKWYPQQSWLNAFKCIADSTGSYTLFNIGKKIPENAQFPPEINTIDKALGAIDVAYHMNHRIGADVLFNPSNGTMKEGIGHYGWEIISDRKIKMVCDNPYPCEFDKGIIEAMAYKFKPSDTRIIKIFHDDDKPCRNHGGDSCTYYITW